MTKFFNEATYRSLHLPKDSTIPDWPFELIKAMPDLLILLLRQNQPPSLERMQLVSMDVELLDESINKPGSVTWTQKILTAQPNQFLTLSGQLLRNELPVANIAIHYFLRGQPRFFKPSPPPSLGNQENLPALSAQDVEAFFLGLGQPNDFFNNRDLARLNGQPYALVPNHLMVALMVCHALQYQPSLMRISLTFYQAVEQNKPLVMFSQLDKQGVTLGMGTDKGIAVLCSAHE
jgi:hypothetical protein